MKKTLLLTVMLAVAHATFAQHLEHVAPEQVGLDSKHLVYADEAIQAEIAKKEIPGAVLAIVRHGKMAYLKAYGNKQVYPTHVPMTTNTIFDLASCSKPIGAGISILILAERGKLRLTDPVNRYIPDFENWKSGKGNDETTIRIEDLLTHTSGLPPYAPTQTLIEKYGSPNPDGLMDYICHVKRDFEPKTDFQYSCLNFITLQHIVEKVSGQTLRDFTRENIYDKLGMDYTDYLPCAPDKKGIWRNTDDAHWANLMNKGEDWRSMIAPTTKEKDGSVLIAQVHDPLAHYLNGGISGNAGLFSNAEDLAILCACLQNGGEWNGKRIMSKQTVETMRKVPRSVANLGRTLAWDCFTDYATNNGDFFSSETYSHTGFTGTSIVIDPVTDTSVILLINAVHPEEGHSVVRLRSLVSNVVAASIVSNEALWSGETYNKHWWKRYNEFLNDTPITNNDIVMLGNSLTENGGDWSGLGWKNVKNRGIIGDVIEGIEKRLHQILPGHPKKIFLLSGTNDVSHDLSTDSIVRLMKHCITSIQNQSPQTKIYLQSLLPINESFGRYKRLTGKTDQFPEINARLEELAKEMGIQYINLFPLFCEKGTNVLRADLTRDGLHVGEEGYKIWCKELRRVVKD